MASWLSPEPLVSIHIHGSAVQQDASTDITLPKTGFSLTLCLASYVWVTSVVVGTSDYMNAGLAFFASKHTAADEHLSLAACLLQGTVY